MSALPWIIGGGLVVVGGAIVIAVRNEKAKQPEAGWCESAQPIAAALGFLIPGQLCGVINKGAAIVGAVVGELLEDEAQRDAENRQLNGEVELPLDAAIKSIAVTVGMGNGGTAARLATRPMLGGSVLRFKNGGVPFSGHPDWSKCAPGTHDMTGKWSGTNQYFVLTTPGKVPSAGEWTGGEFAKYLATEARTSKMFSGQTGDPTTSKALSIVAGKKYTCPKSGEVVVSIGAQLDSVTGVRTVNVYCGPPGSSGLTAPPLGNSTPATSPDPNNYVWVVDHWERKRAT